MSEENKIFECLRDLALSTEEPISNQMQARHLAQCGFAQKKPLVSQINEAIELAVSYGGIDGAHHKDWVIDQMVRKLAGDSYEELVADACAGEDGPSTYSWNTGIAP